MINVRKIIMLPYYYRLASSAFGILGETSEGLATPTILKVQG